MTYDYECVACNSSYTVERSMHEDSVAPICTTCHNSMTRVWAVGGITFNAPGFYSTDNKRG
jgi:putative FmdB family regulatory protein